MTPGTVLRRSPHGERGAQRTRARRRIARGTTLLGVLTLLGAGVAGAVKQTGEHERDGRWWWERASDKECGIHVGKKA